MGLSSPRYVPRSHDGSVAARLTSTVMQHGSGPPATTSQQTPRVCTFSSQKASEQTPGVRNFSSQKDSPPRPSGRSLADFLSSKQRARPGSSDGSTHSGQDSPSSHAGILLSHPIPTPPPMSLSSKFLLDFLCVLCRTGMLPQPNRSKPARPPRLGREGREGATPRPLPSSPPRLRGRARRLDQLLPPCLLLCRGLVTR